MQAKKILGSVLFAAGAIVAAPAPLAHAEDLEIIQIQTAPPVTRYEVVPVQPSGYVWAPGYWDYRGGSHVWVDGRAMRVQEGYEYRPSRWVERDGKWNLDRGTWVRPPTSNP
jgi:WXXGXW repeat (2 copies)